MPTKPKNSGKQPERDVMLTPPHALEPLYPLIPKEWVIWESAYAPESLLAKTFETKGYNVYATGLPDEDYFLFEPDFDYDIEATNYPFSFKYQWLKRAFERGKRFAFLGPYETTFAKEFQTLFRRYHRNPWKIQVLSPERRINYKTPNYGWGMRVWDEIKKKFIMRGASAQMPTMWLTWGLDAEYEYGNPLETFYVPMRSVKYDANDQEIKK